MITPTIAISPDQETTSVRADRIRLHSPRGQTATVLAWWGDKQQLQEVSASSDDGTTQCVKRPDGHYEFPTDKVGAAALNYPPCIVPGCGTPAS